MSENTISASLRSAFSDRQQKPRLSSRPLPTAPTEVKPENPGIKTSYREVPKTKISAENIENARPKVRPSKPTPVPETKLSPAEVGNARPKVRPFRPTPVTETKVPGKIRPAVNPNDDAVKVSLSSSQPQVAKYEPASPATTTIATSKLLERLDDREGRREVFEAFQKYSKQQAASGEGTGELTRENFKKFLSGNEQAAKQASGDEKFFNFLLGNAEAVGQKIFQAQIDAYS